MPEHVSVEVVSNPDAEHRVICFACGVETVHKVLAAVQENGLVPEPDIRWWSQFEIVQCQGCRKLSFREDNQHTEDFHIDHEGEMHLEHHEKLYPPRVEGREQLKNLHSLPWTVQRVYQETHSAIINGLPILAGIGVRAIVESVCKEKQAEGRNLEVKIDDLVAKGVLTESGAEILHGTRLLGNKAAHEQEPVLPEVLNAAVEVVEHLLQTVYILPSIAENLPRRRSASASRGG